MMAGGIGGAVQAVPGSFVELVKVQLQGQTGKWIVALFHSEKKNSFDKYKMFN